MQEDVFKLSDGDIMLWIEQEESICIKAVTKFGDPVEISCHEAKILANKLLEFINLINSR